MGIIEMLIGVIVTLLGALGFFYNKSKAQVKGKEAISTGIKMYIKTEKEKAGESTLSNSIRDFNKRIK